MAVQSLLDRVTVIIPALNEEVAIDFVLRDLPPVGRVVVVDNGSTDRTAQVARRHGAVVVEEPRRGYGAACLRGLQAIQTMVACNEPEPEVITFLDADYSDFPEFLPHLVLPIFRGQADMVIGSRLRGPRQRGAMPPHAVLGNRIFCFLLRGFLGLTCSDLGPFRAIRYSSLCALNMTDRSYGWTLEMQIKAAKRGLRVKEIPVPYRRRIGQSKISGSLSGSVRAALHMFGAFVKYALAPTYSLVGARAVADDPGGRNR